jgi:hypothetical protein
VRQYGCVTCKTVYRVGSVELEELESVWSAVEPSHPSCPTPLCRGKLQRVRKAATSAQLMEAGYEMKEIPFHAFYRAVHGFGGPKGEAASLDKFTHLIKTKKIVGVSAHPVGQPERVILKRLILEDGTILHFDTSARGACCYYIEEPGPSCLEVVDNELRSGSAAEGSDTNREEAGRAAEDSSSAGATASGDGYTADAPTAECSESGGVSIVPVPDNVRKPHGRG